MANKNSGVKKKKLELRIVSDFPQKEKYLKMKRMKKIEKET